MNVKPKGITTPPSEEELSNRLKKVRKLMFQENLDYYVSFDPVNIYYLFYPQVITFAPQVNPPPKPMVTTLSHFLSLLLRTASSNAIGIVAADVLP